jgi:hypothetical protein
MLGNVIAPELLCQSSKTCPGETSAVSFAYSTLLTSPKLHVVSLLCYSLEKRAEGIRLSESIMDRRKQLVRAYRSLYRSALRGVLHASPARYQIRDTMRAAFSPESADTFDARRVKNTVEFLQRAAEYNGIEHKVLKNLVHVRYWQSAASKDTRLRMWAFSRWITLIATWLIFSSVRGNSELDSDIRRHSWAQFDATLEQLNQSLNLCLR